MRLKAEQLASNLDQRGLAPIYCISGDEPLQLLECVDMIRSYAAEHGVEERTVLTVEKGFNWHSLAETGASMSLFSSRRLIELRLGNHKPGREGGTALAGFAAAPPPDTILLLTAAKLDKQSQNTAWYKKLENAGIAIQIWPVDAAHLPGWIIQRARRLGKTMPPEAAGLIAQKVEGNLLAARQEVEKLCLLVDAPQISLDQVISAVYDSTRYDVFTMIEAACLGNTEHVARMLRGLKSEGVEPISIYGGLMWELRRICGMAGAIEAGLAREQAYAEYRVWQQRRAAVNKVLNRLNARQLTALLGVAHETDKALKGAARRNPWELLEYLLLRLAGVKLHVLLPGATK